MSSLKKLFVLFGAQGINYLAPIFLIPVLTNRLGVVGWGKVSLLTSLATIILIFTEYAFHLSAIKIYHARNDLDKDRLFAIVVISKLLLYVLTLPIVLFIYFTWLSEFVPFGAFSWWAAWVLVQSLSSVWYSQIRNETALGFGLEGLSKFIAIITVMLLLNDPDEFWIYFAVSAISLVPSILKWFFAANFLQNAKKIGIEEVFCVIKSGFSAFQLNGLGALFSNAPTIIISHLATLEQAGYYALAERLMRACYGIFVPINIYVYPKISKLIQSNYDNALNFLKLETLGVGSIFFVLGAVVFGLSGHLIPILFGNGFVGAISTVQAMSFYPLVLVLNTILVVQCALSLGVESLFNRINYILGTLKLCAIYLLADYYGSVPCAIVTMLADALCLAIFFGMLIKYLDRRIVDV